MQHFCRNLLAVSCMAISCLTWSGISSAAMLDGLKAYERQDFKTAEQEFTQLLPLANEYAVFNLAVMAYQAEGQPQDLVKAQAYFSHAAALGHPDAAAILAKLTPQLTAEQQQQANTLQASLQQLIELPKEQADTSAAKDAAEESYPHRQAIKRIPPQYPKGAAAKGLFGYVTLRLLIDEQGKVAAADVLDQYPKNVFDRAALQAIKRWTYEPGPKKTISKLQLDFSMGPLSPVRLKQVINEYNLWQYAAMGSQTHQEMLGALLNLTSIASPYHVMVDKDLPAELGRFPEELFKMARPLKPTFAVHENLHGAARLKLDDKGHILSIKHYDDKQQASAQALVGRQITKGGVKDNDYMMFASDAVNTRLIPIVYVPATLDADFWWENAARGGDLNAQRILAARTRVWEQYLLKKGDPAVQAWSGVQKILDGERQQGEQLLQQAIAQGYGAATELKAAL